MTSNLILFPGMDQEVKTPRPSAAEDHDDNEEELNDEYIEQLQQLNSRLQDIADAFSVPVKDVLSDMTYIVVGGDIIETVNSIEP